VDSKLITHDLKLKKCKQSQTVGNSRETVGGKSRLLNKTVRVTTDDSWPRNNY